MEGKNRFQEFWAVPLRFSPKNLTKQKKHSTGGKDRFQEFWAVPLRFSPKNLTKQKKHSTGVLFVTSSGFKPETS